MALYRTRTIATVFPITMSDGRTRWSVQWATPLMPAPAFWQYDTEGEANAVRDRMLSSGQDAADRKRQDRLAYFD